MGHEEELPSELIEEILSRVPPNSLACFRTVSKKWNALFDNKTFINHHKSTIQFVLTTKSKFYSVSIDPEVVVRDLTLDIPGLESLIPKSLVDCNVFLLCDMDKGAVVWNPWLKQTRVIKSQPGLHFEGIGYDSYRRVKKSGYKTIASCKTCWRIHDLGTDTWKDRTCEPSGRNERRKCARSSGNGVSLNGKIYWVVFYDETNDPSCHVHEFDFSSEHFRTFCRLPFVKNHPLDVLVLRVFKGDRFSLLKQCHLTKKIEIWVTKNKISDAYHVAWMTFMRVSIPNLPVLVQIGSNSQPSYFIDDNRLVVCCCDETGRAWIYVMGENKLIRKIKIESVVDHWPSHCAYFPSWVPVPQV